ncbi:MAG: hypothetical protein CSA62_13175 [Planctomycetota bacterium]|nr:MAG: hypothetical protein CSA62_13175 [Planctomycetota bacterium]
MFKLENPGQQASARKGLRRSAISFLGAILCGMIGGGAVIATQQNPLRWNEQHSSKSLSVEAAVLALHDPFASETQLSSAQTIVRAAFSESLPQLLLQRAEGGVLGSEAAVVINALATPQSKRVPTLLERDEIGLRYAEAQLLLQRKYGSVGARRLAIQRIGETLLDTMQGLERIQELGGESGKMAQIHLAWFRSFLALPIPWSSKDRSYGR